MEEIKNIYVYNVYHKIRTHYLFEYSTLCEPDSVNVIIRNIHAFLFLNQACCDRLVQNSKLRIGSLTHLSLASFLWDIGKQYSPRCDAAERGVPSGAILFAYRNFIEKWIKILKSHPAAPNYESGLTQMIMLGESIRQIWVKNIVYSNYDKLFVLFSVINYILCTLRA